MAVTFSNWRSSPDLYLHLVFLSHFLLSSWSHLGGWGGNQLLFQDAFLLVCVLWAIHAKRAPSPGG